MRILAIGDFHGKFPEKLKKEARKADFILSTGDFADTEKIRKMMFKHWTNEKWYEVIGLKKSAQLEKKSFDSGLKILKEINKLNKKVYFVWGNSDFYKEDITSTPDVIIPGFYEDKIRKMKNLKLIERKGIKIFGLEVVGSGGYVDVTEYVKHPIDKEKEKQKVRLKRYNNTKKRLFKLFSKKKLKEFVFLIHYPPYKFFDKVKYRTSPMHGKHVGFEPYNKVIERYNPILVICGHMHEYQGKKKYGESLVVTTGPASEGKAAWIEIENNKVKNVKFLR